MDVGEDAGGDGEGDGRVDKNGEVREMVEVAALVPGGRLLLGRGACRGLGGLPGAGPLRPPAGAPTGPPARGRRRPGRTGRGELFFRGGLVEQAPGVVGGVRAGGRGGPGLAREERGRHGRGARGSPAGAQWAVAGLRYGSARGGAGTARPRTSPRSSPRPARARAPRSGPRPVPMATRRGARGQGCELRARTPGLEEGAPRQRSCDVAARGPSPMYLPFKKKYLLPVFLFLFFKSKI